MPLPAALASRLAKRGLVKVEEIKPQQKPEEVEEVFAEDYDDPSNPEPAPDAPLKSANNVSSQVTAVIPEDSHTVETLIYETIDCPNKWNPYHKCVGYCRTNWGVKDFVPEPVMLKRRDRHVRKYPLPEGWVEVADPKTGRYYYWSVSTDQVSWLSPLHPKATITLPADRLQAMLDNSARASVNKANKEPQMDVDSDLSDLSSSDSTSEDEADRRKDQGCDRRKDQGCDRRYTRPHGRTDKKGSRRSKEDTLDPMDPASYSDIPRGSWSDGLDQRGKAKTGVDVTASGPLFQQRPYPSPGDVLRANREMSEKKP